MIRFVCVAAFSLTTVSASCAAGGVTTDRGASMYMASSNDLIETADSKAKERSKNLASRKLSSSWYVLASFYGAGERLSRYTASGEPFSPLGLTAAHRSLPLGTRILVALRDRQIVVRINDRGPNAATGRALDLSYGAARALGFTATGVVRVRLSLL